MTEARISVERLRMLLNLGNLRVEITDVSYDPVRGHLILYLKGEDVPDVPEVRIRHIRSDETKLEPVP